VLAAKDVGLLVAGGGHAMAAGLTVAAPRSTPSPISSTSGWRTGSQPAATAAPCSSMPRSRRANLPGLVRRARRRRTLRRRLARPRVAAGPVRIVKADVVGDGHLRLVVAGDDGRS
jgi:single-stranded-DNA-specific exonuclease